MRIHLTTLVFSIVFCTTHLSAQTNLDADRFTQISSTDGLSQGTVTRVMQKPGEDYGATLASSIAPRFYESTWFQVIIIIIMIFLGPTIYYLRVQQLKGEKRRQQSITYTLIERQEIERNRIARELHDQLGQDLLLIANNADLALAKLKGKGELQNHLSLLSKTANEAINHVRSIVRDLKPTQLEYLGLTETITSISTTMLSAAKIALQSRIQKIDGLVYKNFEIIIIRCVQEALNNIVRHSCANKVTLEIQILEKAIHIVISDNGKGLPPLLSTGDPDQIIRAGGFGMLNIHERIEHMQGKFIVGSRQGQGTRLEFHIPRSDIKQKERMS